MALSNPAATRPSLGLSRPYELIEAILAELPLIDLIVTSAHLPPLWRSVLETSTKISQFLVGRPRMPDFLMTWPDSQGYAYRCPVKNGMLLICHRISNHEGFLLIQNNSDKNKPTLTILNPASKLTGYVPPTPIPKVWHPGPPKGCANKVRRRPIILEDFGFLELRDMDGNVLVEEAEERDESDFVDYNNYVLWWYLRTDAPEMSPAMLGGAQNRRWRRVLQRGKNFKAVGGGRILNSESCAADSFMVEPKEDATVRRRWSLREKRVLVNWDARRPS